MNKAHGKVQTTIRLTVVTVFIVATAVTALVALGLQYYFSEKMAREAAAELYSTTALSVASELNAISRVNANVIDLLADNPELADPDREAALLGVFIQVLEKNPMLYGVYVGRPDGSLFEVINLDTSDEARNQMRALPPDRWLVMSVENIEGKPTRTFQYLDESLKMRISRNEDASYDATQRPWYQSAYASGLVEVSQPYLFAQLGSAGLTVSKRVVGSDAVVGMDMTLATLSDFLSKNALAEESGLYLYDSEGSIVASNLANRQRDKPLPIPRVSVSADERAYLDSLGTLVVSNELNWPPIDYAQQGQPRGYSVDIIRIISQALNIPIQFENGFTWAELVDRFRAGDIDLLHPLALTPENKDWGLSGASHLALPFALVTLEKEGAPENLEQMQGKTLAIPRGWSVMPLITAAWPDFEVIATESTLDSIEKVLAGEIDATLDNAIILQYIADHYFMSGLRFNAELDLGLKEVPDRFFILSQKDEPLLRTLLDRVILAFGEEQKNYLDSFWLSNDSAESVAGADTVPSSLLIEIAQNPSMHGQLMSSEIGGEDHVLFATATGQGGGSMFVGIVTPVSAVMGPFLNNLFLSLAITAAVLLLLLPLSWLFANPIVRPVRQLAHENDKIRRLEFGEVQRVPSRVKELDELSESMVDMVASIQAHEEAQRQLMDAFIRLIAQAIDDKSAYTGGHCERVPELALMLAEAATKSEDKPFTDFGLKDDEQWRE